MDLRACCKCGGNTSLMIITRRDSLFGFANAAFNPSLQQTISTGQHIEGAANFDAHDLHLGAHGQCTSLAQLQPRVAARADLGLDLFTIH